MTQNPSVRDRRGGVEVERSPRMLEIGVRPRSRQA